MDDLPKTVHSCRGTISELMLTKPSLQSRFVKVLRPLRRRRGRRPLRDDARVQRFHVRRRLVPRAPVGVGPRRDARLPPQRDHGNDGGRAVKRSKPLTAERVAESACGGAVRERSRRTRPPAGLRSAFPLTDDADTHTRRRAGHPHWSQRGEGRCGGDSEDILSCDVLEFGVIIIAYYYI